MSLFTFRRSALSLANSMCARTAVFAVLSGVCVQAHAQLDIVAGSPIYNLPISVPPGIGGMAPRLQLEFNGSAAAGSGWAIKGVSLITRCPSTKLVDGRDIAVTFSTSDRLCLDGQRLIQTNETGVVSGVQQNDALGGAGMVREYRTETDSFARIRAYGMAGGNASNGPAYFKVWTKGGQIIEYGVNSNATSNAQITAQGRAVVVAWPVSRIADLNGNFSDFQYDQRDVASGSAVSGAPLPGREWKLAEVRYTGNGSQAPANKVVFEYVDRAAQDRSESFHHGSKAVGIWMLSKIRTYVSGVAVKTVALTYELGPVSRRSRPKQIRECAGATETKCMPATTFNYAPDVAPSYVANQVFKGNAISWLQFNTTGNSRGVLLGNFAGSGRTDILQWSTNAGDNWIFRSTGTGYFSSELLKFSQPLFSNDACLRSSTAADFNGDGVTDILTISQVNVNCPGLQNTLYLSSRYSFAGKNVPIDFTQTSARVTYHTVCSDNDPMKAPSPSSPMTAMKSTTMSPMLAQSCMGTMEPDGSSSRTAGRSYHLVDANNDGRIDVFTSDLPAYARTMDPPDDAALCAGKVCTRLYLQQADGAFVESATNLASRSIYTVPATASNEYWHQPNQAFVNGDKLPDLITSSGVWLARGDGNYDLNGAANIADGCRYSLDVNGDERTDCLPTVFSIAHQKLYVGDGTSMRQLSNFNLTTPGHELLQLGMNGTVQTAGMVTGDVDGDGRSDIIRWKDDPAQNTVYLSNGDGTFTAAGGMGLAGTPLQKSDGTYTFLTGDFTGSGGLEILRLKRDPSGGDSNSNILFVKTSSTPPDQLASVVSGVGLKTTLAWVPLTNSASGTLGSRYLSDCCDPQNNLPRSFYPLVDVTEPIYVVATAKTESTAGDLVQTTEYAYGGLKSSHDGRGALGFRITREQTSAPNGEPVVEETHYSQHGRYVGKPTSQIVRRGALDRWDAPMLSKTTNVYCDSTSADPNGINATLAAPCATTAKVRRPYLRKSTVETWDANNAALPVTTTINTVNHNGDVTNVVASRSGTTAGLPGQVSTQSVTNLFYPDNIAGDAWILGQVQRSTVSSSVPNSIDSIATTPPVPPPPPPPTPAQMAAARAVIYMMLMDTD